MHTHSHAHCGLRPYAVRCIMSYYSQLLTALRRHAAGLRQKHSTMTAYGIDG